MTKWQEFPIRPQGRPWVGINTRSGKLDDGSGQMEDSSINTIINRGDRLEKRKGLIRGIDERFAGSVCGLHKYTDECGREFLLVADEGGFSIRQPFFIPSFTSSDAYPSDSFQTDGELSLNWNNRGLYTQLGGSLLLVSTSLDGGDLDWFKLATNFSYQVEGEWTSGTDATAVFVIKKGAIARLEARIVDVAGLKTADVVWTDSLGIETTIGSLTLPAGTTTGSVIFSYNRDAGNGVFTIEMVVQPTGESAQTFQDLATINALSDADFGQGTALRLERTSFASFSSIESIQGDPL